MARKFTTEKFDGGKKEYEVAFKLDHDTGLFEADVDGDTLEHETYAGLRKMVAAHVLKLDGLTFEPFYEVSFSSYAESGMRVSVVAVSKETVEKVSRWGREPEVGRRRYAVECDPETLTFDPSLPHLEHAPNRPYQTRRSHERRRFIAATEESREMLLEQLENFAAIYEQRNRVARLEENCKQRLIEKLEGESDDD